MKKIRLFEDFIKNYGEKMPKADFAKMKKGEEVLYIGKSYTVVDADEAIVKLEDEDGKTISVNYNMFNKKGAITEEEQMIEEGVNDPGILKAFFMAGGPGSGKSFVATELFDFPKSAVSSVSYATGLKLVNNDNAFEKAIKDAGLDIGKIADYAKDKDMWDKIVMPLRDKAKRLTKRMQDNYIGGRLGQVIDGTGKDYNKIKGHRNLYKDMGYDTYMVFVNTSLPVALERNQQRDRKLPDAMVEKMWQAVQDNLGRFQKLFGPDRMLIVDNSSYDNQDLLNQIEKQIARHLRTPIQNPIGKQWIKENSQPYAKMKNRPS